MLYPQIYVQSFLLFGWQQMFYIHEPSLHNLRLHRRNKLEWNFANQRWYDWLKIQLDQYQTQKSFKVHHEHWKIQRVFVFDLTSAYYILIHKICDTLHDSL